MSMHKCAKHKQIFIALNKDVGFEYPNYVKFVLDFYQNKNMSGVEIAEYIEQNTGIEITPRSIQRVVAKYGRVRSVKEAYNLAIKRGRVTWKCKDFKYKRSRLSNKLRYAILKRDNSKCVLCGRGIEDGIMLQVEHVTPVSKGGLSNPDNLRTLCHECNKGKQLSENEI